MNLKVTTWSVKAILKTLTRLVMMMMTLTPKMNIKDKDDNYDDDNKFKFKFFYFTDNDKKKMIRREVKIMFIGGMVVMMMLMTI